MADDDQDLEDELNEEEGLEEGEGEGEEEEPKGVSDWMASATPWWVVSVLLHILTIIFLGLITMTFKDVSQDDSVVVVTELVKPKDAVEDKPPEPKSKLEADRNTNATDPNATNMSTIEVPPEILAKAELSDHFETVNPDRPDTKSAFGNPDAHMFHSTSGSDDNAGGGGVGGATLDDLIGVAGGGSPGSGGGWGGGDGTGQGNDKGNGHGSFGQRGGGGRKLLVARHGGSRATELGVENALKWLAAHQEADGHWDTKKYEAAEKTDTACTGLALLAFLGAGHTEKVGKYKDNVRRAVAWLKSKQSAEGCIFDTSDASGHRGIGYPHAICNMAMSEAAGMARIPDTVDSAQKAIAYTCNKHQQGDEKDEYARGAWRYGPKMAPDTSVSGWFIMALKSSKVAGLNIPQGSFDGAIKYLDKVEHPIDGGAQDKGYGKASVYWYMESEGKTSPRLCAIGNLCRQFLGWKKEDLQASVEHFVQEGGMPNWGKVDLYYWYYGTLCVFQQGGDLWKNWNDAMKKALVENQRKGGDEDGSWDPTGAYDKEWGRVGQTALSCLCLEVYYRYLPMFKK